MRGRANQRTSELRSDWQARRPAPLVIALAFFLTSAVAAAPENPRYPSPIEIAVSPDGGRLYVLCEGTDQVAVYDSRTRSLIRNIPVGRVPKGIALDRAGKRLYVANSWSDNVSEIDTATLSIMRTLPAGFEPNAALPDRDGKFLYAANRISNDVAVIDLATGKEIKRLLAGRGASYLTLSPDGARIYCTHIYPEAGGEFRTPPKSEITVIDTAKQVVIDRPALPGAAGVFHTAFSADGRLGLAAELRPKNLVPMAHVAHGWVFGNSLALFGPDVDGVIQILSMSWIATTRRPSPSWSRRIKSTALRLYHAAPTASPLIDLHDVARPTCEPPMRLPGALWPMTSPPPRTTLPRASRLAGPRRASRSRPMAAPSTSPTATATRSP